MELIIVYDDTCEKSEAISDIIGDKRFSNILIKNKCLENYCKENLSRIFSEFQWKKVCSIVEYSSIILDMKKKIGTDTKIIHYFSNYFTSDSKKVSLSCCKLKDIDKPVRLINNKSAVAGIFPDCASYIEFCKKIISGQKAIDIISSLKGTIEIDGVINLSIIENFIQCITEDFSSRYFNSLKENEYTITKSSSNKKKIEAEYKFYHFLPDDMKFWFVMPFNYEETDDYASYTMERLHMTNLAIKWVHGSIDYGEFENLMDKYFFFFKSRHKKECSKTEYLRIANYLYKDKINDRISDLKKFDEYEKIETCLKICDEIKLENLLERYFLLKNRIESKNNYPYFFVIGHGDPCFANALYNRITQTLKFVDPKGALTEDEMWTHPYYDLVKLSHSICGRYDFFNSALFNIKINSSFEYELEIPFDNSKYIEIFKNKIEENGFDYLTVRIYEVSLFLSMLPLHIDNPHRILGFILNAHNILKEVESIV